LTVKKHTAATHTWSGASEQGGAGVVQYLTSQWGSHLIGGIDENRQIHSSGTYRDSQSL
jgi:hypothetical protein